MNLVQLAIHFPARPRMTCQWITNERPYTFCGDPVCKPGGSWCATHHAKAYLPALPLKPREYAETYIARRKA